MSVSSSTKAVLFALALSVLGGKAVHAEADCGSEEMWQKTILAETVEECHAKAEAMAKGCSDESRGSTWGQKFQAIAVHDCLSSIMNKRLDQRLLPLKTKDHAQFEKEMQAQKHFNKAIENTCETYNSCDGTMYQLSKWECSNALLEWRAQQAVQINAAQLTVSAIETPTVLKDSEVQSFAHAVCTMPKTLFKDSVMPPHCEQRVMAEFDQKTGGDCR